MCRLILAAAAMAALSGSPAASITVTETADFNVGLIVPTSVGPLMIGTNTISGSVSGVCDVAFDEDCFRFTGDGGDAISFLIPSGATLTGASATISGLTTDGSGTPRVLRDPSRI